MLVCKEELWVKTSLLNEPPPTQLGENIGLCYYSQLKNSNFKIFSSMVGKDEKNTFIYLLLCY